MNLLFIGAGKMATALATAIVKNKLLPLENIKAADISPAAREAFNAATGVTVVENAAEWAANADVILLAVKPQVAEAAARALPQLHKGTLIISICAGIPIAKLQSWFNTGKIIRVMPNTPLMVGKGASAFATGPDADDKDADFAMSILGQAGIARRVTENLLDAVTALSGSGPAYIFEMAKAMAMAGEAAGLDPELSLDLTVQTIAGAAEMMARKIDTPDKLRDAVTSPNGTTAAGLAVMAKDDFRKTILDTVIAAKDRSIELGKGSK